MSERTRRGWRGRRAWGAAAVCAAACGAWVVSGWSYPVDLLASFQVWVVLVAAAVGVALIVRRRFGPSALVGAGCVVGLWPVVAGRAVHLPGVDLDRPPAPGTVRVVAFNIGPRNERWREDLDRVLGWHADVVVVVEVSFGFYRGVRREGFLDGSGWSWTERPRTSDSFSPSFTFSRSPIVRRVSTGSPSQASYVSVVDTPSIGRLEVFSVHPASPRTLGRWRAGNRALRASATPAGTRRAVVAGDINGGPASWRQRSLRGRGFLACKPLTGGWGTFSMQWARALRLQLDDVWAGPGLKPIGWSRVRMAGSDHAAVVVDLITDDP